MGSLPPGATPRVAAAADHSRFVQRVRRRWPQALPLLPPWRPDGDTIEALVAALRGQGHGLPAALRVARHLVIERLAVLDVEVGASVTDITATMSTLAEVVLELALREALAEADARHGVPRDADGRRIDFWIVGMGKLGARELNVSSDIDLIYVCEDDGHTDGPVPVSAGEYFAWVARRLYALVGETTDDGLVFRVDLALRPNGNSGPPVVSLAMLEEYFLVQGREWERFAWLKSRVVAPRDSVRSGRALPLRQLVTPFVYRRYLDYGVFESLRQLHRRIRDEAQRRAAGRPERANDVKLSRGGIREIEFIVQLLLVVRGGQYPEIRTRSTLKALQRLADRGLMAPDTASALARGYALLRRIEHRIQYLDDQQTHLLPTQDADLAWIADSLGFTGEHGTCGLLQALGEVRELVAGEFDALLQQGGGVDGARLCRGCGPGPLPVDSEALAERLPPAMAERLKPWRTSPRVQALREEGKLRAGILMQRTAKAVAAGEVPIEAAERFIDWLEPLLRRESYLALMVERPVVLQRLLRMLGLARWPMRYLGSHPGVIDELADERLLAQRFDANEFSVGLVERHDAWERSGEASEESLLDTLRRAHHAELFRTLVRDVEGRITVEEVADELSALADAVLSCALDWAWRHLKQRHRPTPRLAVIGYGKLGGKELGYGSDLDLVFLYDDADEPDPDRAQEVYGAFARKLITWLTLRTAAGELFDIDTALRPNGNAGLLVTSVSAFERYQSGRGSNAAWTWEHQAITRARCCAGDAGVGARFEQVRRSLLVAPREPAVLREEIRAMRERVRDAHPDRPGRFDVKHSGGVHHAAAGAQPPLRDNAGNIALLHRAEAAGLLAPGVGAAAADAYRTLRRLQHRARLDEQPTRVDPDSVSAERAAILALWRQVFPA